MKFKKIKNILEFILNAIFSLLAVYLLVLLLFPNINFIETNSFYLIVIIEIYLVVFLLINTFKDIFSKVFPRYLSFLVAFFLYYYSQYIFFYFKFDNPDIIYLNSVFTIYIFIQYLIFKNIKYNKKIKFPDKSIFKWNYIIILFSISFISIFIILKKSEFDNKQIILYSSSFLFAINPFFNKRLLQIFNNNLQLALNQLNINANSFFLLKIFQIKTFVFSRKKLIGSGEYILDNFIQRHTQKRETVLNIAASLFKLWQSNFFEIIESEMENQADIIDLEIIIKNNEGIIVNDKNENEYILGFYSFIKEFSEVKNTHTFYLLKNKIIAGKFNVFEKTNTNNLLIVNILNKYGNTVLLNNDDKINFNSDVVEFDKTYFCEDVEQEKDILNKLNSKAPTAFFTKNKTLISQADLTFHIADNTASDENNENYLSLPESKINEIENLMLLTKKVHIWLNYALLIFVSINILMLIFAAFFYMYPILILSLNITISVIYMLVFNKMPFKSKLKKY